MSYQFLPQAILGPFAGVYIDRHDKKYIMIIADIVIAVATLCGTFADTIGISTWFFISGVMIIILGLAHMCFQDIRKLRVFKFKIDK